MSLTHKALAKHREKFISMFMTKYCLLSPKIPTSKLSCTQSLTGSHSCCGMSTYHIPIKKYNSVSGDIMQHIRPDVYLLRQKTDLCMSQQVSSSITLRVLMWGLLELRSSQGRQRNSLVTLYNSSATVKGNGKMCKI